MPLKVGTNAWNDRGSPDFTLCSKDYSLRLNLVLSSSFFKRQTSKIIESGKSVN